MSSMMQSMRCGWLITSHARWWMLVVVVLGAAMNCSVAAKEAHWIWSPEHQKDRVPNVACYFRKSVNLRSVEQAQVNIVADDEYELFINGRRIASGADAKKLDEYDISRFLRRGVNTIAIRVVNGRGSTAALAARVLVKERDGGWTNYSTDDSWKTNLRPLPLWNTQLYNDSRWTAARAYGILGETIPWDRQEGVATEDLHRGERFRAAADFEVQRVIDGEQTGSLIAMTFNEFGHVIASREGGPLLLIYDGNRDGQADDVRVYCDEVTNCQGILAFNGEVFVTGQGPDGSGLYRLADQDQDGKLESVRTLLKFEGPVGEHGAHGLVLGPDGLLYIVLGNHGRSATPYAEASPHMNYYEGDLVGPRYEDPGGHAVGMKAPGGVVIRTDVDGQSVQLVAGGLRNAYDLAFNREGDLFIHDSDMESDEGTSWYRPTRLYHVTPGAEFGWRSGWAKWPEHYVDALPAVLETGRGSPTGSVCYNHYMFPQRYWGALFLADWSEGRILSVTLKRSGATYTAQSEVFLEGSPLNVTDLDVGPDGSLYFVTGGRDTSGGLYRVKWRGNVPASLLNLGNGISAAIRQPQLQSAWSRQKTAELKQQIGSRWESQLAGVARSSANPFYYRARALDLMQLYGPPPKAELLETLSRDPSEEVRAKLADVMGYMEADGAQETLQRLLSDNDRTVRRKACEALVRKGLVVPYEQLETLLVSDDRFEAWAARRLLERIPVENWREELLGTDVHRLLIQASLALVIADPSRQNAADVIQALSQQMHRFVSDRNFVDMLRVMQVALIRGDVGAEDATGLRDQLAEEFPAGHPLMNRELVRLLVYLQASSILDRYLEYLDSDAPDVDKLHLALYLRFLRSGWTTEQKLALLEFYEKAKSHEGGNSYPLYLRNFERDFAKLLEPEETRAVLAQGARWPNAALGALYTLPAKLDDSTRETLEQLDGELFDRHDEVVEPLKVGIVAVLTRSGDARSTAYLHEIWKRDPQRRQAVALGLAQFPGEENWDYLVRTLPVLEGAAAREVLARLHTVPKRPKEPHYFRQVILLGLELEDQGAEDAAGLLEFWTGETMPAADSWETTMAAWQRWFAERYPDQPEAVLPVAPENSKWQFDQLLEYLTGEGQDKGSAERGAAVFVKAECVKCHRFGSQGEALGPDLTSVSNRFTRKEILQSILFPSHVIASQYESKTILTTNGRSFTGIVGPGGVGEKVVLQANGQKLTLRDDEIDEIAPSKISAMPSGLLDPLSLDEISDLFAYLLQLPSRHITRAESDSTRK